MRSSPPLAILACALLAGCAATPSRAPDARDPFERLNRASFAFNDALDRRIVRPVARGYRKVVPRPVQRGLTNFFDNLQTPVVFVNDVLQGKPGPAAHDLGRFVMNSTLGLGGLLDPASAAGLDRNEEDFGQTLGRWGAGPGPYFVVPIYGPRTLRDGIGSLADNYASPHHYLEDDGTRWGIEAVGQFEGRVRLLDGESVLARVYDRYAFIRNAYLQRRAYLVSDGAVPEQPVEDESLELEQELLKELEEEAPTEPAEDDAAKAPPEASPAP